MTDAQFEQLRAIQLAQLAMLENMNANLHLLTQGTKGGQASNQNWDRAMKLCEDARKKLNAQAAP